MRWAVASTPPPAAAAFVPMVVVALKRIPGEGRGG